LISAVVPKFVPNTIIEAPINGSPVFASVILPLSVPVDWAKVEAKRKKKITREYLYLIKVKLVIQPPLRFN
jgi:hypothetical protein